MKRRIMRSMACVALAASAACVPAQGVDPVATMPDELLFDPGHFSYGVAAPIRSNGHEIRVTRGTSKVPIHLAWRLPSGEARDIALPEVVAQVAQAWVAHGRLVVQGWLNGALATEIDIYDAGSGKRVDRFWCYGAIGSFDGRRIAFVKFYPSHGSKSPESQYRMYDLARPPELNRPSYRRDDEASPADATRAGVALFPLAASEIDRDNFDVPEDRAHQQVSHFSWSPDGRELAWIDGQGGHAALIVVDTAGVVEPGRVIVHRAPVPRLDTLCSLSTKDDCFNAPAELIDVSFAVDGFSIAARALPGDAPRVTRIARSRLAVVEQARWQVDAGDDAPRARSETH